MAALFALDDRPPRVYAPSVGVTVALIFSNALSMFASLLIIFTAVRFKRLRRHPGPLVIFRSLCDALFCGTSLVSHLYFRIGTGPGAEAGSPVDCQVFSFLTEWSAIAAELYLLAIAADLTISMRNPFTNFKRNMRYYHAGAVGAAAAAGLLLIFLRIHGHEAYGRDNFLGVCWVRNFEDTDSGDGSISISFWSFFFGPLIFVYVIATGTLVLASRRLRQGLPETFDARLDIYRSTLRAIFCYIIFWAILIAVYVVISLIDASAPPAFLSLLLAFALGSKGTVTGIVWLLTFGKDLTLSCHRGCVLRSDQPTLADSAAATPSAAASGAGGGGVSGAQPAARKPTNDRDDNADLRPFLNQSLRREVIYYVTLGLARSVARTAVARSSGGSAVGLDAAYGKYGIRCNVLTLSRRKEERGLFDLEANKKRIHASASYTQLAALAEAAQAAAPGPAAAAATAAPSSGSLVPAESSVASSVPPVLPPLLGVVAAASAAAAAAPAEPWLAAPRPGQTAHSRSGGGGGSGLRRPSALVPAGYRGGGGGGGSEPAGSSGSGIALQPQQPQPQQPALPMRGASELRLPMLSQAREDDVEEQYRLGGQQQQRHAQHHHRHPPGSSHPGSSRRSPASPSAAADAASSTPTPTPAAAAAGGGLNSQSSTRHSSRQDARGGGGSSTLQQPLLADDEHHQQQLQHTAEGDRPRRRAAGTGHPRHDGGGGGFGGQSEASTPPRLAAAAAAGSSPASFSPLPSAAAADAAAASGCCGCGDGGGTRGRRRGLIGAATHWLGSLLCGVAADGTTGGARHRFVDFEPFLFRRLRLQVGISDHEYVTALSRTRREKFSEGASDAFFYFSLDERMIVKTLDGAEVDVLLRMLHDYTAYMSAHPHSLVARFYGLHQITMYGHSTFFVVMQNVMVSSGATVHETYDLKGSWVNRNRKPLERGQKTECRYCGQRFRMGEGARLYTDGSSRHACPARPNRPHEPNACLKDNDLNLKLRLGAATAQALGDQIVADTEFLRRHGVTDYSLLVGVHRTKYKLVAMHNGAGAGAGGGDGAGLSSPVPSRTPASVSVCGASPLLRAAAPAAGVVASGGRLPPLARRATIGVGAPQQPLQQLAARGAMMLARQDSSGSAAMSVHSDDGQDAFPVDGGQQQQQQQQQRLVHMPELHLGAGGSGGGGGPHRLRLQLAHRSLGGGGGGGIVAGTSTPIPIHMPSPVPGGLRAGERGGAAYSIGSVFGSPAAAAARSLLEPMWGIDLAPSDLAGSPRLDHASLSHRGGGRGGGRSSSRRPFPPAASPPEEEEEESYADVGQAAAPGRFLVGKLPPHAVGRVPLSHAAADHVAVALQAALPSTPPPHISSPQIGLALGATPAAAPAPAAGGGGGGGGMSEADRLEYSPPSLTGSPLTPPEEQVVVPQQLQIDEDGGISSVGAADAGATVDAKINGGGDGEEEEGEAAAGSALEGAPAPLSPGLPAAVVLEDEEDEGAGQFEEDDDDRGPAQAAAAAAAATAAAVAARKSPRGSAALQRGLSVGNFSPHLSPAAVATPRTGVGAGRGGQGTPPPALQRAASLPAVTLQAAIIASSAGSGGGSSSGSVGGGGAAAPARLSPAHSLNAGVGPPAKPRSVVSGFGGDGGSVGRNPHALASALHGSGGLETVADEEEAEADGEGEGGAVDEPPTLPFYREYRGGLRATLIEGPGVYYIGLVDVLQTYTWAKWAERQFKVFFLLQNGNGISAMRPDRYAARFRSRVIAALIDGWVNHNVDAAAADGGRRGGDGGGGDAADWDGEVTAAGAARGGAAAALSKAGGGGGKAAAPQLR